MKKLFLLIAASVSLVQASAQSTNSIVFVGSKAPKAVGGVETNPAPRIAARNNAVSTNKSTAAQSSWFNYTDIMSSSSTSKFYYNPLSQDSNVIYNFSNGNGGIWAHGFGLSFDPTDSVYFGGDANLKTSAGVIANTSYLPKFRVTQGNAYSIDSIAFPLKYYRNDPNTALVDTLIITLVKAKRSSNTTPGIFGFHYSTLTSVTPDGKAGFGTLLIDYRNAKVDDSVPTSARVTITKYLDATVAGDTTTGTGSGYLKMTTNGIALPASMSVAPGELVVAYVVYRHKQYAVNTPVANANYCRFYTTDISGSGSSPRQCVGSMMCGLIATDETIYNGAPGDTTGFKPQGHNVAIPHIAYNADGSYSDFSMRVTCTDCPSLDVASINSNIQGVEAYPNPTTADITINFNLKEAANTTVSISNTVGQVIASQKMGKVAGGNAVFSTTSLANGVYFYTVEANGQRTTNRFVVAH